MSATKHTPGPWEAREHYADIAISAASFREPALVRRIIGRSDECQTALRAEQVANARLIAAAPEMARALVALLGCVNDNGELSRIADRSFVEVLAIARASLAKAGVSHG